MAPRFAYLDSGFACQQRSLDKELNPGMWEPFFGGHLRPNESYLDGANRELSEEIGLQADNLKLMSIFKRLDSKRNNYNNEFQGIFQMTWRGDLADLHFDDGEVEQIKWTPLDKVLAHLKNGDSQWTNCGYEIKLIESQAHTK